MNKSTSPKSIQDLELRVIGYVGLPVAFSKKRPMIGFDII